MDRSLMQTSIEHKDHEKSNCQREIRQRNGCHNVTPAMLELILTNASKWLEKMLTSCQYISNKTFQY